MAQQQFPLQQDASPFWIHVQSVDGEIEYYDQYQWLPPLQSPYPYGGVDLGIGYYAPIPNINFPSTINQFPPLQEHHQPLVVPLPAPPSSLPIPIPNSHGPTTESSPFSSLSTSASTSPISAAASDVCRQAQPHFNEETQQWSCGGCNKAFSDKYGTERHIATVGLKVTCRYCGSRVSALEFSRRRHFRRESCRRQGIERGFTTRNEEDAFIEDD